MNFANYKPADASSEAVTASIRRVVQDAAANVLQIAAAKERRDALLLDGDAKALEAAEDALRAARDDEERLAAVKVELETRLVEAKRQEELSKVSSALTARVGATEALNSFWAKDGARLTTLLARAQSLKADYDDAGSNLSMVRQIAYSRLADADHATISAGTGASLVPAVEPLMLMLDRSPVLLGAPEPEPWPSTAPVPLSTPAIAHNEVPAARPAEIQDGRAFWSNRSAATRSAGR